MHQPPATATARAMVPEMGSVAIHESYRKAWNAARNVERPLVALGVQWKIFGGFARLSLPCDTAPKP
jgi:hypothetical protein